MAIGSISVDATGAVGVYRIRVKGWTVHHSVIGRDAEVEGSVLEVIQNCGRAAGVEAGWNVGLGQVWQGAPEGGSGSDRRFTPHNGCYANSKP